MRHSSPRRAPGRRTPAVIARWPAAAVRAVSGRLRDESGYTTETVIVTALLAALALAVIGIIVAKVTGLATSINV